MSLESKIEALTTAVNQLIAVMSAGSASVPQHAPVTQAPVAAPIAVAPVAPPVAAPMVQMTAPSFTAPVAAPVAAPAPAAAPFGNPQELMQYVMGAYQAMGPQKGANIQGILQSLGHANINDVKPEQYGQLYVAIEQLKAS